MYKCSPIYNIFDIISSDIKRGTNMNKLWKYAFASVILLIALQGCVKPEEVVLGDLANYTSN